MKDDLISKGVINMTRGGKRQGAGRPQAIKNQYLKNILRVTDSEKDFIKFARDKKIDLSALIKTLSVFLLCLFAFASMPVSALTLTASVEYNVDTARAVAFDNTDMTIPLSEFKDDMTDWLYYGNMSYLAGRIPAVYGLKLLPFYNNKGKLIAYGVCYNKTPNKIFYYNAKGNLLKTELNPTPDKYPRKTMAYNTKGKLYTVSFYVKKGELYNFDAKGNLIVHWVGDTAYDANGAKMNISRNLNR